MQYTYVNGHKSANILKKTYLMIWIHESGEIM